MIAAVLLRKFRTNQARGFGQLRGRHPDALSTLHVSGWIVSRTPWTPGAIEGRELRRANAPVAPLLPGHHMEVEVRRFLPAVDAVVLERKYPEGPIRPDERLCESPRRDQHGRAFLVGKIQQQGDMPARDHATLADFELPGIDHGERVLVLIHDRPSFFATCHPLTEIARIPHRKLDQLPSPVQRFQSGGSTCQPFNEATRITGASALLRCTGTQCIGGASNLTVRAPIWVIG